MIHSALVSWLPANLRGGAQLPPTLRYVGVSQFPDDDPNGNLWSVELLFDEPPAEQAKGAATEAKVRFLFDQAPQARLQAGAHFDLYEGLTKVAKVDVLD